MTAEEWVILLVRIAGSLPVLRWPFAGGCIAVLTDLSDLFLRSYLDLGGVGNYQAFDKWLDQVYLLTFLIVAFRWRGPERGVAIALYAFRLTGFFVFEATGARWTLLLFPNVFEFWFLLVAAMHRWRPRFRFDGASAATAVGALTVIKLVQEYSLHVARVLDGFTAREFVEALKGPFG